MVDDTDQNSPNDIAIVGMALRVPGARNVHEFWQNLRGGVESIRNLSEDELLKAGEAADRMHHPNYVRRTAELPDMEMFDADFFGLSPKEAAIMDPQHRHFLECAWEAMEDAGHTPDSNSGPVGVFAGCGMGSYFYFNVCSNRQLVDQVGMFLLRHTGNDKDFLATRASFSFDLRGPSVNVQTACSTSLVAVHYACQSLLSGECDMALAGGVTIELPHRRGYMFQEGEILSPDGHCRAFDHRAAGTVFGSGAGVVVLRRLSDALADNDIIHGVIKGTAINNDGGSKAGYLAPSVTGQAEAIIEAQGLAGVSAETVQYIECHGTGTYLGDPIEIEALTQAFRQSTARTGFCRVGSVKSNIGHLDTAAGVVSLIKATLAVKNAEIPPTLGFEKPNPAIDFAKSPFIVNDRLTEWPSTGGGLRRAGVNSLGVGGTNAHAIVEQAPRTANAGGRPKLADDEPTVLILAAKQRKALDDAAQRLGDALASDAELALDDTAYTLHAGRKHFEHRRIVAIRGRADAVAALTQPDLKRAFTHSALESPSGAVFLLPGGGAQHAGMARQLYERDAFFRATVDEGLGYLDTAAAAEIRAVWLGDAAASRSGAETFLRPSVQLPAILIVEIALARLWMKWGVKPVALIGHSMGENAAACLSGVMSYRDVVRLVRLRGELFDTVEPGGMLSVPLSPDALKERLPAELDIASINAPELCVVSGRDEDLDHFKQALEADGIDATRITINIAAHSRMLDPILGRFEAFLRSIDLRAPTIPIISNGNGEILADRDATDPAYWVRHLRSTVQFAKGLATLAADRNRVYIEVGPSRALSSLTKAQGSIDANQVINSLPHPEEAWDEQLHFLAAVGRAWATGLKVDLDKLWAQREPRRVTLPTYPFQHKHYFLDPVVSSGATGVDAAPIIKLPDMADWGYVPIWKRSLPDYAAGAEKDVRSWLFFLDDAGVGAEIAARLRHHGHRVVTVLAGDTFAKRSADEYVICPEDGRSGYDALLSGLQADGAVPSRIVHLWLLTEKETFRPGSSFFHRNQECGFYSLLYLAQALGDAAMTGDMQFTLVTNGMQRVGEEAVPYPEKATILGPGLTIPKEMAGASVRLIDIDLRDAATAKPAASGVLSTLFGGKPVDMPRPAIDQLWEDILSEPATEVVAYRNGQRWLRGYDKLSLAAADGNSGLRQHGVYLFTGGLGDLALAIAGNLAEHYQARLVLIGRAALPPRSRWDAYRKMLPSSDRRRRALEAIEAFEAKGAQVLYLSADVSNPDEMAAALTAARAEFGEINGVFHAAGVVNDELIQMKTLESAEIVLGPKLHGTAVLDELLADTKLDLFVLFSSTSTDTAPAGQVDYVAANAYLNAYAESAASRQDRKTVALHWGVWNEVGLAARAMGLVENKAETTSPQSKTTGSFFQRWVEDASGITWLEAELGPKDHWMLDEHRLISGQSILPGTGYIELIAQAINEYGLAFESQIEDLAFLRPLDVDDGKTKKIRVRLEPVDDGYRVVVVASVSGDADAGFQKHAEAILRYRARAVPKPLDAGAIARRCAEKRVAPAGEAMRTAQEQHLRFGPRWRVLQSLALGDAEALAELELPAMYHNDLEAGVLLHPALLDIATGFAMELIEGYDPADVLWAPASYGRIKLFRHLPDHVMSWARLVDSTEFGDGYAAFDITIATPDGDVIAEIERFLIKRLDDDVSFASVRPVHETGANASGRDQAQPSPAMLQLAAQVRQGILPSEGFEALTRVLSAGRPQAIVSSMDLKLLREQASRVAAGPTAGALFERPALDSDYVAPRNEVEQTLVGFWRELLGVEQIGIHDNFFDIGGHSLIAVRLFRMIKKEYGLDFPISVLFEAPTIAQCAELIAAQRPDAAEAKSTGAVADQKVKAATTHLVAMHPGQNPGATPFFICAGMFGNILNLRHLALHIGADRPVYGLQARGLYGDQEPHETFEEMASACLAEIRTIQPQGPYLLGGFSGGGLTAYEIARQLTADGEEVAQLVMLDTPLPTQPPLSALDKASMKLQDLQRERGAFFTNWIRNRIRWEQEKAQRRDAAQQHVSAENFHNQKIETAFRQALELYDVQPYAGPVTLFRPKGVVLYRLSGGRRLQEGRTILLDDNGWTPLIADLTVIEVPGDHDSMVLEPFVRVLSNRLRASIRTPRQDAPSRLAAE